ncbi:VCBS repeat-containing protein, partial [Candidatus Pseudothioglobus singularis]|nr:VCBS repeat-containing protein [Candidatus Pseudothioglobus singularis]
LGDSDGNLTYSPYLLIDNREIPGMSLGGQSIVADYNNDGVMDFYITDPGVQDWDGFRDSYFLSQKDGTWVESSETHLSHPNFISSNNGTTGDIDNDGDMDIVYTEMNRYERGTSLWCLMNDGTGFLKKRKCGGADSFNIELADLDGDGDLDALIGSHENEYGMGFANSFTGILWNDGKGKFNKHNSTRLPEHKQKFSAIPEVSASDLDNDSDLDIVYSRTGGDPFYVGAAIQIIENLGNKKFKDHGLIILEESGHIFDIKFRDFDGDGDNDIYLASEGDNDVNNGTVLLNNGNFNFDIVRPDEALTLFTDGSNKKINIGYKKHTLTDEEQSVEDELAAFEAELAAELGE